MAPANRNVGDSNFTYPQGFGSAGSVSIMRQNDSQVTVDPGSSIHDPKAADFSAGFYMEDCPQ